MTTELNKVSLVIATYNEEASLGFVLNEISNYDFFEVIIVDNNSQDKTIDIANKFNTKVITRKKVVGEVQLFKHSTLLRENILHIWMVMVHIILKELLIC